MKSVASALTLALAATASPAMADQSGLIPYAGVLVGYDTSSTKSLGAKDSTPKLTYGIALGLDTMVAPRTRFGVEVEYMNSKQRNTLAIDALNALDVSYRRDVAVSVRAGYEVTPHLLAYIKGGYTNRRAIASGLAAGTVGGLPAAVPFNAARNLGGYRVAAGVEYGTKLRARLEYRLSHYKGPRGSADPVAPELGYSATSHQVVAGLLYGF